MCYGYGPSRRSLLAAGLGLGTAALAAGSPAAAAAPHHPGRDRVPPGRISIQLWTVRDDLARDYDATLAYLAETGYPRVELALGYFGRTARQLRSFLDGLGIRASSSHDGISPDDAALETKIANAVTLGQSYLVVPYLNSTSEDEWKAWAERMNVEAETARKAGLRYGYHNHAHEFTTDLGGGRTPWDVLTAELDPRLVHLEIDIYWAVTGGVGRGAADPVRFAIDVIREAPQRVLQFHVKDRHLDGDMADLGTGTIDFRRIFDAHRVKEYIVENDTPDVTPRRTAEVGHHYLRRVRF
ncbi:sugar phosphate isomerase/epimerase family protein [Planomonospora venezuelensis]|uniref:Sugar phosphate isomerase/epimerase n=1 Tax=Planomonospora venezuelensis TaxID=1999 RepID=A0A841D990_PLAVE|nr:sugar phosphate isomerase/epimerase [Planomonospora venezuelensis]MBB5967192.1 sugar phosphate isomerase/epimerase [Planomonospora venezuelensis]GIN02961.1 sugar phosphate isomerase [Planomonospora venezuelensis]